MRPSIDHTVTVEADSSRPLAHLSRRFARGAISAFIAVAVALSAPVGVGVGVAWADPYGYDGDDSVDVSPEPADDPAPVEPGPEEPVPDDPGPVDPGPVDPGPVDAGPEEPGPEPAEGPPPAQDPGDTGVDETPREPEESGTGENPANTGDAGGNEDQPGPEGQTDPVPGDPDIAVAPEADEIAAEAGLAELFDPDPANDTDLDELREFAETETTTTTETVETTTEQSISQWSSNWVSYDQYYRPVVTNPYRTPLSLVYDYGGSPRIVTIPPLQRGVLDVPQAGVYSFTALANRNAGTPAISVGSFSGGGYAPAPGQPPPAKPAPATPLRNVVVDFNLGDKKYTPIVVKSVVDVGDDAAVGGRHLLLDGEVPVWGRWKSEDPSGQRVFEVNKTQTLPGLNQPGQSPPPGYTLTSAESSANPQAQHSEKSSSRIWVIVGVTAALVIAIAVGALVFRRRRPAG